MGINENDRYHDFKATPFTCPNCKTDLNYFSDLGQEYLYCPKCIDFIYDVETGEALQPFRD